MALISEAIVFCVGVPGLQILPLIYRMSAFFDNRRMTVCLTVNSHD